MSDVAIRPATLQDAAVVATLFSEFNALLGVDGLPEEESFAPELLNVTESQMARRLHAMTGIERVLLAESEGEQAGLCCLRLIPYIGQDVPYAEVTQLYVRSRFQRQGVGAALLSAAEARARLAGATCVHIITGRNNRNAQSFYAAQGYRSDDVVFDKYFVGEPAHA
ncbi:MAG TPA: GNAT family N-acetyltransferase [Dehalococcoidia bacterium]|nr:GNAT family N-acetyltransferase [Dehalococcoidia bacterium]